MTVLFKKTLTVSVGLKLLFKITSLGLMQDTGCLGLVLWDDPERDGMGKVGEGFRIRNMCTPMVDSC